jgi:CheY-like chemotaxis protein
MSGSQISENSIRILLADDDKDDRFFFQEAFKEIEAKTSIETVSDGEQLGIYLEKKGNPLPHLLFLDLNLPRKNGLECLHDIRTNSAFNDLLVIIYSTSSSERDISESFQKGANLYIRKSNDFFTLTKVMNKVINVDWKTHKENLNEATFVFKL